MKIYLTLKKGKVKKMYRTGTTRRYLSKLRKSNADYFNIKVEYGKHKDVYGDMVMFYNEYDGDSKKEAIQALQAFLE